MNPSRRVDLGGLENETRRFLVRPFLPRFFPRCAEWRRAPGAFRQLKEENEAAFPPGREGKNTKNRDLVGKASCPIRSSQVNRQ